ncbi:MAG: HEAT repeat domain-containing protein [Candidatus Acidiferrales bacterium]
MNANGRKQRFLASLIPAILLVAIQAAAQTPRVSNAKMETRSAAVGLAQAFQSIVAGQASPAWIGYAVPAVSPDRQICCFDSYANNFDGNNGCGICRLEKSSGEINMNNRDSGGTGGDTVKLEGPRNIFILFRVSDKRVEKIRLLSDDCQLDAGGLPLIWLTGAPPAESVALLAPIAQQAPDEDSNHGSRVSQQALAAIALTGDPAADKALGSFAAPNQPEHLREKAAFWLGSARGKEGYEILKRMAHDDSSDRVREKVTFALSLSRQPEAVEEMIRMAKSDSSSRVRGQALFWLGQKAGKKAVAAISDAIENDPETEVKKKAVFALSQLPRDEAVPKLIEVAQSNRNREVRKQAMFWLGQSNDPRALAFFEDVLEH